MPLAPGQTIGRYVVEASLGHGGMGSVYRARDTLLERRVALKVLRAESVGEGGSDGAARLLREARAAAALDHPNAAAVFDVGEHEGQPYIAMELVPGRPLREFVGSSAPALAERVRWLTEIARALAAAHKRGLVHRDVKPENVMVREDGLVKVVDFGIAKRSVATDVTARLTQTAEGTFLGTPLYMAPEQLTGDAVDGRADQFAWGVVAFELFAGKLPWRSSDAASLVADVLTADPPPLAASTIPPDVEAVVRRALRKHPDDRFASMDDLVAALATESMTPREHALAQSAVVGTRRSSTRARALSVAAIALIAAGGASLAVAARSPIRYGDSLVLASAAPSSSARSTTALTDKPIPPSPSREAMAAYAEALHAVRDGSASVSALSRAVSLDPSYAPARLRLARQFLAFDAHEKGRAELAEASRLRSSLPPGDLAILETLQAYVARTPPDFDKVLALARSASQRFPSDPEVALLETSMLRQAERGEELLASATRALELDPSLADAWTLRATAETMLDRRDDALRSYDECLRVAPLAALCSYGRIELLQKSGRCAEMEDAARERIATAPSASNGYAALGDALASRGKPYEAVRAALESHWLRIAEDQRETHRAAEEARLELFGGSFGAARAIAARLATQLGGDASQGRTGDAASLEVSALLEEGRTAQAVAVADAFFAKRDALSPDLWEAGDALEEDHTPALLSAKRRAGALSAKGFHAALDAFVEKWRERVPAAAAKRLWGYAYLVSAVTAEDATAALAARAALEPVSIDDFMIRVGLGHVLLLANRPGEAIAPLRAATATCNAFSDSLEHTHAYAWLGDALAATGDRAGACDAYRAVLDRWGQSRTSVTAAHARARSAALGCR